MTSEYGGFDASNDPVSDALNRDRWAGLVALRGLLPVFPNREALPTPTADYRGCPCLVLGVDGSGDPDTLYVCVRAADEVTYTWETLATGTP